MNGRFLLDTNAIIALLNGNTGISHQLQNTAWIGMSVISELEFLSFRHLSQNDIALFQSFKARIYIINLESQDTVLTNTII
jgi:tRNA(fMet)-specific endonuclease VapC